ncbi:MAG: beta-propeller fold lactonase family protein [Actinomycetia bacterium]|nr:beta-propeller fold lactonase family protein [Actinomycetes bacterium]
MSELVLIANAGDGTISTLRLHRDPEPRLEVLATSGELEGCGTFAVDSENDLVFAAYKGDPPGIAVLRLDREDGALTELSRTDVSDGLTYLALAQGGAALLGASYGGGFGAVWPVEGQRLGEQHSSFTYDNLHCIISAEVHGDFGGGERVYAVSLGEDLIAQFRFDEDGNLAPLEPAVAQAPEGSGARHLVVDGMNAYLVTEFSGEAIRYEIRPDGSLDQAEAVGVVDPGADLAHSRFGADPQEENLIWGADVHRAGEFLITSERSSSMLTVTRVGEDGRLGEVVGFTATEQVPRGFNVSPDGRFVVAVGEESTHAQLLELDADGTLTERDRVEIGAGANWVRFLR